ncbi:MAG: hypothetical protein HDQ95_16240 [Roseburia sp.]|nr:hypothetical protein [Roseburia sp.]
MHKRNNRIKRIVALLAVLLCICGILSGADMWKTYAASLSRPDTSGGQTESGDTLNVDLATGTGQEAVMGSPSEGTYTAGDDGTGTIALDNPSGGRMHVNIGQTIDLYAPNADTDYTDVIAFSGNYTFMAAGGRGGNIATKDVCAGVTAALGGYGSVITNSSIDYSSGQSITYRKGSNGTSVSVSEATNTTSWNSSTSSATLKSLMGSRINGGLIGEAGGWRAYSAVAQAGSASYIQVSGDNYILAGGGAPGVVMFRCLNGSYKAEGLNGMHADVTPPLPAGCDGFYNPGSSSMSRRYRDYDGTSNINAGRIVGATAKNGIPVVNVFGGGVQYEDMFYGWVTNHSNTKESSFSNVYPGYSGLASRSGSKFSTAGMNDSAYSISVDISATESSPYVRLKCNAKYITVTNPTREGYDFDGWTCSPGVTVVSQTGSGYRFKVTDGGATITAKWKARIYTITFDGNGADGGSTPQQTCYADKTYLLNPNGFTKTGYTFSGWARTPGGDVMYADRASVCNLNEGKGTNVTLYAKWTANQYTIVFDPNGGTGQIDSITAAYDEEITLPDGASAYKKYTRNNENVTADVLSGALVPAGETGADNETKAYASVFLGWALEDGKDLFKPQHVVGETVQNLAEEDGATVTLYAVWDDCPWIHAEDRYYTLEEAQSGYITYDLLMSYATAEDREDGSPILPGEHEDGTSFKMTNYAPTDFTQFNASGASSETFQVVDSAGSVYRKTIMVYVVDTTPVVEKPVGYTRFINEYYYNQPYEYGGLEDDSIWKTDPEYVAVIQSAFDNLRNDTPEMVFEFTHEDILEMKEFVQVNGIGNTKYDDALQRFYDQFMAPNRTK